MSRETIARISIGALRHNLDRVRQLAPASAVVAVVKADAYGHGIAAAVAGLAQSDVLAVATAEEARQLRDAGWSGRLLVLEGFAGPRELETIAATGAEYVVHHRSQLDLLVGTTSPSGLAGGAGTVQGIQPWLKLDSGMHRLGFPAEQAKNLAETLRKLSGGVAPVLMSHFACADEPDHPLNEAQLARFDGAVARLPGAVSLANSAALIGLATTQRDYVRPGIMLYGVSPFANAVGEDHGLRPVMSLSCRLLAINEAEAGETIGYGARYRCSERMRIGVAGIGYGDGYPRAMPDGTPVLLNGREASLAGRVSMDLITIDLRGHDDARVGDEILLWGDGLPVERIARQAGMIPYELLSGLTARVARKAV